MTAGRPGSPPWPPWASLLPALRRRWVRVAPHLNDTVLRIKQTSPDIIVQTGYVPDGMSVEQAKDLRARDPICVHELEQLAGRHQFTRQPFLARRHNAAKPLAKLARLLAVARHQHDVRTALG